MAGFAALLFLLQALPSLQAATPLKPGDRVVFYGDSITEQRLYTLYIQQYIQCRYPELKATFFNAGWSGDRAPGALARLERDVLSLKPTVVTLFFGMNDGNYAALNDRTLTTYRDNLEKIIQALQAKDVRVIVFTPGCVDYDRKKALGACDYNQTLEALGNAGKGLAEKYQCDFVDVHHPMLAFQTEQKARQPGFSMIPDAVHPDAKGHLVMARQMLTAFAEPVPPLGAADLKAGTAEGGVQLVSQAGNQAVLKGKLPAFPFWIDPSSQGVASDCGLLEFALPKLVVKGLPEGFYDVLVDGKAILKGVSAQALASGTPLPAASPAAKLLHDLISARQGNYYTAWRTVRLPLMDDPAYRDSICQGLMAADTGFQEAIWATAGRRPEVAIAIVPAPEGPNLALHKKYECSDPNNYNWGSGGLTDGSWETTSSGCFATGNAAAFPKHVTIDLERPAPVSMVVLGVPAFGSTKSVKVSVSADSQAFTEVGAHDFALRKQERHVFSFPPVDARYVRVTYVENHKEDVNFSPAFAFTTEVEVHAKSAK
ncbi:MAG: GDSL-type esterase/lipase family protein [Lentisphaeria bacterium]